MYMARLGVQKMDGAEEDVLPLPPFEGLTAVFDCFPYFNNFLKINVIFREKAATHLSNQIRVAAF